MVTSDTNFLSKITEKIDVLDNFETFQNKSHKRPIEEPNI